MVILTIDDAVVFFSLVRPFQEWERSYGLAKARAIYDANEAPQAAVPKYLKGRVERGEALPYVEIPTKSSEGLVEAVLRSVMSEMKVELFAELLDTMGKTGVRG